MDDKERATKILEDTHNEDVDFPIELRHNDNDNLVYEKKGKNKFTAYINLKGEEP